MGWPRQRANGKWQAQYRGPDGKIRSAGTFDRKSQADAAWKAAETDIARGEWIDPLKASYTVSDAYSRWDATRTIADTTRATQSLVWTLHVEPRWGSVRVEDVHPLDVQKWVNTLNLSPSRAGLALSLLSNSIIGAVLEGRRRDNPCAHVRIPRGRTHADTAPRTAVTRDDVNRLLTVYDPKFRVLPMLAAYAGLRWGECVGLRVEDVDFLRGELSVRQTVIEPGGAPRVKPYPKSESGRRTVPLDPGLRDELAARLALYPPASDGRIVTVDGERPMRRAPHHETYWTPAREKAKLVLRFHDLRGAYGSWLIERGVDPATVARLMGHRTAQVTWERYVRSVGVDSKQVLDALRPAAQSAAQDGVS